MKIKNKKNYQKVCSSLNGLDGDMASFDEIGERLGMSENEVKRIYNRAMSKLKSPKFIKVLWEYTKINLKNIG